MNYSPCSWFPEQFNAGLWSIILTDQPYIQTAMFGKPYDLEQKS